jgi:hypothetical protein
MASVLLGLLVATLAVSAGASRALGRIRIRSRRSSNLHNPRRSPHATSWDLLAVTMQRMYFFKCGTSAATSWASAANSSAPK